jgi:ATP-dependent RNA helicase RhlE
MKALANFRGGKTRVLVASDIASRGLDVDDISHVINYDMPNVAETYVHRIGRTGRAGARGQAVTFCCEDQRDDLRDIERLLGNAIPVLRHSIGTAAPAPRKAPGPSRSGPRRTETQNEPAAPAARRPATPQQQKNEFWRSRRKHGPARGAKPTFKRRGR